MPSRIRKNIRTYCFIDASNLFYGGFKKLGWRIDYQKLIIYLRRKYNVSKAFYYGGIETHSYLGKQNLLGDFNIRRLLQYFNRWGYEGKSYKKAKFYMKLKSFGYILRLKPIKHFFCSDGSTKIKANCDVDLTLDMMRYKNQFDRFVLLSGDGDFEVVLQYFEKEGKDFFILANAKNTAFNIKKNYHKQYRNFPEIRELIEEK